MCVEVCLSACSAHEAPLNIDARRLSNGHRSLSVCLYSMAHLQAWAGKHATQPGVYLDFSSICPDCSRGPHHGRGRWRAAGLEQATA
jgi:hypothetical protein